MGIRRSRAICEVEEFQGRLDIHLGLRQDRDFGIGVWISIERLNGAAPA
jgi:hypothetical protein